MKIKFILFSTLFVAATLIGVAAEDTFQGASVKKPFDASEHGNRGKTSSTQILYHGGPVMNSMNNTVYVIYYGTFPPTSEPIINDFLVGLNGSAQYGVNRTYNEGGATLGIPITYSFDTAANIYSDNYSLGKQLSNSSIPAVVAHAINGGLPANEAGVYLVVTAPDVKISGFCNSFCAYHTSSTAIKPGMHIRYALIPDPTQRCSACNGGVALYGDTATPNGDMGADTMTDDIVHELSETVTDPDINAWYTQNGAENGDLCNYVYATPSTPPVQTGVNGAGATYHYNATLPKATPGTRNYLIQLIWKNSGTGFCAAQ